MRFGRVALWGGLALALSLAGGVYVVGRGRSSDAAQAHAAIPKEPRVPVGLATATTTDFPINLSSLGTVQAYNTVAVRTRIDGQIVTIAFREGQMVGKGDLLVEIDARPYRAALEQARAKKAQDEALLANSKADLQRYTKLGDFAARQQLDTQTATVAQQTAQVVSDAAAVDNAETQLGYATVRAPITGIAGFRQVDIGNIVNAATQTGIVTITQVEPISVVFTAPEDQLPDISAAMARGDVSVAAFSTDGSRKLSDGRLEVINNQVDTATGTIRLKATFDNKDHVLWPGLSVSVRTLVGVQHDALVVPDGAVQHGPKGLYVFAVDETGRARIRPVKIARSDDGRSVVAAGLRAGDIVIASGQYRVDDGTLVVDPNATNRQAQAEGR